MAEVIRSVAEDQSRILDAIRTLHLPEGFDMDVTYGNGSFWKGRDDKPQLCFDKDPTCGVAVADSTALPVADESVGSVVFDPPFLTYVRSGRSGNGAMAMARRFGGYWTYRELEDHYKGTIVEASRVLKRKGILIVKCQDIIHNHKMHPTHINVVNWAEDFRLRDLFVLIGGGRLPAPNRNGVQRHARVSHSYFLVLEKNV